MLQAVFFCEPPPKYSCFMMEPLPRYAGDRTAFAAGYRCKHFSCCDPLGTETRLMMSGGARVIKKKKEKEKRKTP